MKKQFLFSLIAVISFISCSIKTNGQCLTNSLFIGTGFDPITGTYITPGADGATPVLDPKWRISYVSADMISAISSTTTTPGVTAVSSCSPANVITPFPFSWLTTGNWISCANVTSIYDNGSGTCTTGAQSYAVFTRPFILCNADYVTFYIGVANDNYISSMDVDGVSLSFSQPCMYPVVSTNYSAYTSTNPSLSLSEGLHRLNITVQNTNLPAPSDNGYGLNVTGYVTSTSNSIMGESSACSGSMCAYVVCNGSTVSISGPTGGTWSSSNASIATVSGTASGTVTGVSSGMAIITNTLCGAVATYSVTVDAPLSAISGAGSFCQGSTLTLSDAISGGSWISAAPGVATVDISTGVVTGVTGGTAVISYTNSCGSVTTTVTVHPAASITGPSLVCVGSSVPLSDATAGGVWSVSSITGTATIGSATGIVTGISNGTVEIDYTLPTGCVVTTTMNVNPAAITGASAVCAGSSITMSDATLGGVWSTAGGTGSATIGSATGIVTGISAGNVVIDYTSPAGCSVTTTVNVDPLPASITGITTICYNTISSLSDVTTGGVWSSDDLSVARVELTPGDIRGWGPGTTAITYTLSSTGCYMTTSVTVFALPVITGPAILCVGDVVTFSDSPPGGTWSSGVPGVADVGSVSGIVTAITGIGHTFINYTDPGTGCVGKHFLTVYMPPNAILAVTTDVCVGATIALSDEITGGVWVSGSPHIATVGSTTGIVTGVSVAPVVISYIIPTTGCYITTTINVSMALPISGLTTVCTGATVTLSNAVSGGTWSSGSPGNATIGGSSGIVTGLSPGSVTMTYTTTAGCVSTHAMSVLTGPAAITGPTGVCVGATITLSDATGGGTWSSSSGLATVGSLSGIVTGVSPGTVVITYKLGSVCLVTSTITINPLPATISATLPLCVGITSTLTNATSGGTWSSSNTGIATVGSSTGIMTGMAAGVVTMTYMLTATGCRSTRTFTISPPPVAITGVTSVCAGATTTLSNASGSGTWSSGSTGIATVVSGSGVVTGVAGGTAIITFTRSTTGCYVTTSVTVHPLPSAITGYTTVCVGSTTVLSDADAGGTWTSGTPAVATVGTGTGVVTGVSTGTSIITYTLPTGCYTSTSVSVITPTAITGAGGVCPGSTITLSNSIAGGVWTSGTTGVATIGSGTGIVTGVATGTTTITYTYGTGCIATYTLTVYPLPTVYTVTGGGSYCMGTAGVHIYLTNSDAGVDYQVFSGGSPVGSPVAGTGALLDMGLFTTTGVYTIEATDVTTGCTATMTGGATVFVLPIPSAFTVTGGGSYCAGGTGVAVGLSGSVTGINYQLLIGGSPTGSPVAGTGSAISFGLQTGAGTYTVLATHATSGCTAVMTGSVTITIITTAAITGPGAVCEGNTIALSDATTGGTWSSGSTGIATVVSGSGVVTGVAGGTAVITYTSPTGCYVTTTITVHPVPLPIVGPAGVCVGASITLSDPTTGGVWSSNSLSVATAGSLTGVITGVMTGSVTISYTMPSGCATTKTITVAPSPSVIMGSTGVCPGTTITLSNSVAGGVWSATAGTGSATIGSATGVVTGVTTGTVLISYTTMCASVTRSIMVNPLPAAITGATSLCAGSSITILSDATSGGTWSSSNTGVATIGSTSRVITAIAAGTTVITYKLTGTGCAVNTTVTVYSTSVCPCSVGTSPFTTIDGGSIGTPLGAGRYYIPVNTLITDPGSTITLSNTQLVMDAGVQLDVDWSTELILSGAHLYGCNMWQGLVLQPEPATPPTISARILVTGGTLIEDAITAIYAQDPVNTGAGNIVETDNAIFNRNVRGIQINNYPWLEATYPFAFRNTVFTSRNFSAYTSGASVYPNVWPPTTGVKGLKTAWTPTDPIFDPPFNIDNPNAGGAGVAYSGITCKNTMPADIGILLTGVGTYSASATYWSVPIPSHYAEMVIGDDAPFGEGTYQNLFDNLQYGAHLTNSNVTFVNNAFTHMNSYVGYAGGEAGTGIYAQAINQRVNQNRLRVYSSAGSALKNVFYGFRSGVECYNYFNMVGENCYMMNKNAGTSYHPLGQFGFLGKSSLYDLLNISYNTITNVSTGISFWATNMPTGSVFGWPGQLTGVSNVNGNTIQAHPSGYGSITTQRVNLAIALQNTISSGVRGRPIGSAHVDFNTVNDAENGIYINNYWRQPAITSQNYIYVRPQITGLRRRLQYGINHTASLKTVAYENYVTKSTGATAPLSDSARAFYIANNTGPNIGCNIEESLGRGYEFFLGNLGTAWHDNSMNDNLKGMVMNNANIGPQRYAGHPMANEWHGTWSAAIPQTYVLGLLPPTASPLYVNPGSITNPTQNKSQYPSTFYVPGTTIHTVSGTYASPCPVAPTGYDNHAAAMVMYEDVAQDHIAYAYLVAPHRWISQYELWKSIQEDSTLIDSSAVLAQFATMATGRSRYAYLTDLERDLADGNYASAAIKLGYDIDSMVNTDFDSVTGVEMTDGMGANHIVQNYQDYYGLYMKYMDSSLTGSDSLAIMTLAGLCPHIHGNVVYHARALYSDIYRDLTVFNDDSCLEADTTYIAERRANHGTNPGIVNINKLQQQYIMYPNPNDGNFELKQVIVDKEPLWAEVFDVVGRSVGKEKVSFTTATTQLHVGNVAPGMYLLQLTDSKKRIFKVKFVIER